MLDVGVGSGLHRRQKGANTHWTGERALCVAHGRRPFRAVTRRGFTVTPSPDALRRAPTGERALCVARMAAFWAPYVAASAALDAAPADGLALVAPPAADADVAAHEVGRRDAAYKDLGAQQRRATASPRARGGQSSYEFVTLSHDAARKDLGAQQLRSNCLLAARTSCCRSAPRALFSPPPRRPTRRAAAARRRPTRRPTRPRRGRRGSASSP
jgi:hypothetical protein